MIENDINSVNEIKALALDMISNAKSGYPGIALSAAPILYTLYAKHLNFNPENPGWLNRDRFVLASGHATSVLYATLHICGFPITKEDLKQYRNIDSNLPGYPDKELTPGIDVSIGSAGLGISNGVGLALAERYLRNIVKSEEEEQALIDYRTYVFCSDIDLMEGVSYEATSFAGAQKLDKFMLLCDISGITNDGEVKNNFIEDLEMRFESIGFYVGTVKDGSNLKLIDKAITNAKKSKKPSVVFFKTIIGKDSRNENKSVSFEGPLSDDDVFAIKRKLNVTVAPFEVRKDSVVYIRSLINNRVREKYSLYINSFNKIKSSANDRLLKLLQLLVNKEFNIPFESLNFKVNDSYNENLLMTNHKILNMVASKTEFLFGGSADVASTTKVYIDHTSIQSPEKPLGRNINFGLREEAMAGILNGISLSGLKTYCSTKLINADRLKSSMRLSAYMQLPIVYFFTHDGFGNGEDGPTQESLEQLDMLRSIPNLKVFRPSDINEVLGIWEYICKEKGPICVILGNNKMPKVLNTHPKLTLKGGYIVKKEEVHLDGILVATGREVLDALNIAVELKKENLDIRVVTMPSIELFLKQDKTYQDQILPKTCKTIVLEPNSKLSWGIFVKDPNDIIGLNDFGYSGHQEEILRKIGYDYESLKITIAKLFLSNRKN